MKKGYLYIALATFFFSTMEIALKVIAGDFNPIQLTFIRFLIGSIVLFPLAVKSLKNKKLKLKGRDYLSFALTGFICVVVSMTLYQLAIMNAPASVVAILFSCNPVFVVLFAFLLLKEKIYKHTIVSIVVSVAGILVIMNPAHLAGNFTGIVFTLLAAVTFALYGVAGKKHSMACGGIALSCFSFLFGSAEMFLLIMVSRIGAVSLLLRRAGLNDFASIPILRGFAPDNILDIVYIGVFVTGLGYMFYFLAMEKTSAATASLVFFIKPALAPVLALLLIREPITPAMLAGMVLIIAGSLISFIPGIRLKKDLKEDAEEILSEIRAETDETAMKP